MLEDQFNAVAARGVPSPKRHNLVVSLLNQRLSRGENERGRGDEEVGPRRKADSLQVGGGLAAILYEATQKKIHADVVEKRWSRSHRPDQTRPGLMLGFRNIWVPSVNTEYSVLA